MLAVACRGRDRIRDRDLIQRERTCSGSIVRLLAGDRGEHLIDQVNLGRGGVHRGVHEPVAEASEAGGQFLGFPVRPLSELAAEDVDGVVVATFDRPEQRVVDLGALGIPAGKCLTLRRLADPVAHTEERTGR